MEKIMSMSFDDFEYLLFHGLLPSVHREKRNPTDPPILHREVTGIHYKYSHWAYNNRNLLQYYNEEELFKYSPYNMGKYHPNAFAPNETYFKTWKDAVYAYMYDYYNFSYYEEYKAAQEALMIADEPYAWVDQQLEETCYYYPNAWMDQQLEENSYYNPNSWVDQRLEDMYYYQPSAWVDQRLEDMYCADGEYDTAYVEAQINEETFAQPIYCIQNTGLTLVELSNNSYDLYTISVMV